MAEPKDMIVPLLREMRTEINSRFDGVDGRIERVARRLKKLEEAQVSFRQALSADSLFSKLVTGEFEERIEGLEKKIKSFEKLEQRVRELEQHK